MADADELIIKIGADFTELKKELAKSDKAVNKFSKDGVKGTKDFSKGISELTTGVKGLSVALAGATAGMGLIVKAQVEAARETKLWGERLGISTKKFSEFAAVGRRFHVSMDEVGDGIKDFSLKVTDAANGATGYEDALKKIGLQSANLIRLKPEEQFFALSEAISKSSKELSRFALDELGSDPLLKMITLLSQGEDELRNMTNEARLLGESLSDIEIANIEKLDKSITKMKASLDSLAKEFTSTIAPALTEVAEKATSMLREISKQDKAQKNYEEIGAQARVLKNEIKELTEAFFNASEAEEAFIKSKLESKQAELEALQRPFQDRSLDESDGIKRVQLEQVTIQATKELLTEFDVWLIDRFKKRSEQEKQIGFEDHARKIGLIDEFAEFNLNHRRAEEKSEKQHQMKMRAIWESGAKGRMQIAGNMLSNLSVLMESENRKMFEAGKASAIANTVIDTIAAAQKSYTSLAGIPIVGPALGAAAAATAVAAGAVRVQKIQSTTMGGGAGSTGGAAGGGGGTASAPQAATGQAGPAGEATQTTQFDISLQGESFSGEQVRSLIGEINSATSDNVQLNTGTG